MTLNSQIELISAYEKLEKLSVTERLAGFSFFLFWDSANYSLPQACVQEFDEYPPNDCNSPGAILTVLLDPKRFDSFFSGLTDYFSSIEDGLEEGIADSEEKLEQWWDQQRSGVATEIWQHSEPLSKQLIS